MLGLSGGCVFNTAGPPQTKKTHTAIRASLLAVNIDLCTARRQYSPRVTACLEMEHR